MKRRRYFFAALAVLMAGILSACGSSKTTTSVTVAPQLSSVILGGTQQFSATVSGPSDTTVSWSVSGTGCNGTTCGTIDTNGLYTAPSKMISPNTVTITATSNADSTATGTSTVSLESGVRVQISPTSATIGSGEHINLTATVTGTTDTGVNWDVNGTPNGDASTGQICVVGSNPCQAPTTSVNTVAFLAPSSVLGTTQVTVDAVSVLDTAQKSSITVTIMPAVTPVVYSISPTQTAQGALVQQVYVNVAPNYNFFSTSTVLANGQAVPTTFISTSLLRGEVPAAQMQSGQKVEIAVQTQGGSVSNSKPLTVTPVRPAVISFSPVSVPQCPSGSSGNSSISLDGGYFSPSTAVSFNGQAVGATLKSPNQIAVSLPGSDLTTAGLYQLTLTNSAAAQPESAVNVAVEPSATPTNLATVNVGQEPSAVAVDPTTGYAVVVNSGSNSISLIDVGSQSCASGSCSLIATIPVGKDPTSVAVDPLRHLAIVVNQGDNTLSLVNLSTLNPTDTQTVHLPTGYVPVSVGENPLTGHALVANQSTNTVTVVDLSQTPATVTTVDVTQGGTRPGGTGLNPRVAIEPRLDWAIVTPGGSGAISAIDMSHTVISPITAQPTFNVVFSYTLTTSVTGIALNPITDELLLSDPNTNGAFTFSLLDESTGSVTDANTGGVGYDNVAAAVNPLTNIGVLVDKGTGTIQLVDMRDEQAIGLPVTVGSAPVAIAFDDVTDRAVVVNQGGASVSVLSLGGVRSLAVTQASASRLFTSSTSQSLTLIGGGFSSPAVRIDGTALPASDVVLESSRVIDVTIPSLYLSGPRILNFDVQNSGGDLSNVFQIPVIQAVPVGIAPVGVAVDPASNTAIVTNSGSGTASLIDLSSGAVTATVDVGSDPLGVGVFSRAGEAVVANSGDDTASLVDLCTAASPDASASCVPSAVSYPVSSTTSTVQQPVAVDIDPDAAVAAIANEQSNTVSFLNAITGSVLSSLPVDTGPLGVAIDPYIQFAGVLCATQSPPTIDIVNVQSGYTGGSAILSGHITGANLPTGIALDPVNDLFLVADSTGNRILVIDPQNNKITQNIGTGINPTSIAYNYNALEAVTTNTDSHSASVVEITPAGSQVRALMLMDGSSQQSVAINPVTNVAVVADQSHNQVLLVPLAH